MVTEIENEFFKEPDYVYYFQCASSTWLSIDMSDQFFQSTLGSIVSQRVVNAVVMPEFDSFIWPYKHACSLPALGMIGVNPGIGYGGTAGFLFVPVESPTLVFKDNSIPYGKVIIKRTKRLD